MNLKRTAAQAMGKQMAFVAMIFGTLLSDMCFSWYRISAGVGIEAMFWEVEQSIFASERDVGNRLYNVLPLARNKQIG